MTAGTLPACAPHPPVWLDRVIVMAGEGQPSTSFLHHDNKAVDGGTKPRHDEWTRRRYAIPVRLNALQALTVAAESRR